MGAWPDVCSVSRMGSRDAARANSVTTLNNIAQQQQWRKGHARWKSLSW